MNIATDLIPPANQTAGVVVPEDASFEEFAQTQFVLQCATYDVTDDPAEKQHATRILRHTTDGTMSDAGQIWTLYINDDAACYLLDRA